MANCGPLLTRDGENTAKTWLKWITSYGAPKWLVTDGGSHFINRVMDTLLQLSETSKHTTTAYSPMSNGTVERACREVLGAMRRLAMEYEIPFTHWPELVPVVVQILNAQPRRKLGGRTPNQVFLGTDIDKPILLCHKSPGEGMIKLSLQEIRDKQILEIEKLADAIDNIHKQCAENAQNLRQKARATHNAKTNVLPINFTEGDFVLMATNVQKNRHKLLARWTGPYKVIRLVNEQVAKVQELIGAKQIKTVHTSRLKMYADRNLNTTSELIEHLEYENTALYVVEEFLGIRKFRGDLQVRTKWLGFEDSEATWEPFETICQDVPVRLREYLDSTPGISETLRAECLDYMNLHR